MQYQSLKKLYYKEASKHQEAYIARFSAPFTRRFEFDIRHPNSGTTHPLFFCYTEELFFLISDILKNCEALTAIMQLTPPIALQQLLYQSLRDEIYSTNEIEGVHSSRKEIQDALDNQDISNKNNRFHNIAGKYLSLSEGKTATFKTCQELRQFYDDFVLDEIKKGNPQNAPDGLLFRKNGVSVLSSTEKVLHEGLFPEEKIMSAMTSALNLLNDESIPPLVRIPIFHYLFGYIHPFYDGNGRTSRFIASYYLSREIPNLPALRLSMTMCQKRKDYYNMFDETNDAHNCGDLTPFVTRFLELILITIQKLKNTLQGKNRQLHEYAEALKKLLALHNIEDETTFKICHILIQAAMFSSSGATIQQLRDTLKVSRGTIDTRLNKIPPEWIIKNTGARRHKYRFNVMVLREQIRQK